jgi:hypothetical protein
MATPVRALSLICGLPLAATDASAQPLDAYKREAQEAIRELCHGEDLPSDVKTAIEKHYPDDQATGFQTGDVRGAFSLYKENEPGQPRRDAKDEGREAAPELPEKLSIGGGRYGSPPAGP